MFPYGVVIVPEGFFGIVIVPEAFFTEQLSYQRDFFVVVIVLECCFLYYVLVIVPECFYWVIVVPTIS